MDAEADRNAQWGSDSVGSRGDELADAVSGDQRESGAKACALEELMEEDRQEKRNDCAISVSNCDGDAQV